MNILKKTLHLYFVWCVATSFYAQTSTLQKAKNPNDFQKITNLYLNDKLNDTIYMHKIDSTSNAYFNKGIMFGIDELATDFKVYEKVAWSKKQYGAYRCNYYILLLNNAYSASKWGSAIYYAEKAKKQGEIDNYPRLFIDFTVKMSIYSNTGEVERIIKAYEENQNTIEHFGSKIAEKPEKYYMEGRDLLPIFDLVINSYYNNDDTLKAEKVHQIANSVVKSMNKATTYTEEYKQYNDFYLLSFAFCKAYYHKQNQEALHILNKMTAKVEKQQQINYLTYDVIRNKADLFLEMKQVDSASYYFNKMAEDLIFELDNPELFYQYKAQLELIKGNLEKANEFLNKSLDESFKNNIKLAGEIDDLLYAQTEAEHHKLALEKSEIEKKERNTWIIAISLLLVIITIGGIILLRLKDRKLKKTLKSLDETADIQIALMKQFETEVRKEEQERISQNLHDDLAGLLAAIKNNVDLQLTEIKENGPQAKLLQLSGMINTAFNSVRGKSHELFENSQFPNEEMFGQYIMHLAHIAFPDTHYRLNVQIDDYSLVNTSIEFRSELIRVIQEAFANIVKHAKASQIDLLIYKENEKLFVNIKDNGKGLSVKNKQNTLGINSMKKRLKKFNADFSLRNDGAGVEINIAIPENRIDRISGIR